MSREEFARWARQTRAAQLTRDCIVAGILVGIGVLLLIWLYS
jgi:hypothetical protein